jgi:hypothetical protein
MKTVTIQIGNSDDKLTQVDWAHCVAEARQQIEAHVHQVHFFGWSEPSATWQNVCCVAEIEESRIRSLQDVLRNVANAWKQDCIAFTLGETIMLNANEVSP